MNNDYDEIEDMNNYYVALEQRTVYRQNTCPMQLYFEQEIKPRLKTKYILINRDNIWIEIKEWEYLRL